ncbi:MAG TPA: helix-turn-helix transcriptional regulator [Acidimicrobiales bacterium]|nr:helix-turn-helix transcriptional regulator [Acidimicrobiales bacterium]
MGPKRPAEARYRGMDPNQVVAYNLARARQLRGLTQDEAAAALEPYLGVRWSKASFSQAERSVRGKFVRRFDAEEIVAFARAFELPITWFFLPPPAWSDGDAVKLTTADARRYGTEIGLLVDLVFGDDDDQRKLLEARLSEFFEELGADGVTDAQRRVGGAAELRAAAVVRHRLGDLEQWEAWLRTVADELAQLRTDTAATADEPESVAAVAALGEKRRRRKAMKR